ncbi:UNVERIFIED_CONTAM: hypothetical protein K2H54_002801 [Gekko kuhli]
MEWPERLELPLPSCPSEPGDSPSILGIFSSDSVAGSCEEPQDTAELAEVMDGAQVGGVSTRRRQTESEAREQKRREDHWVWGVKKLSALGVKYARYATGIQWYTAKFL